MLYNQIDMLLIIENELTIHLNNTVILYVMVWAWRLMFKLWE
jgi:hypothetical protein